MPPRKAAAADTGAGLSQEQQQAHREHLKLLDKALKSRVLVTPNGSQPVEPLKPKKALLKSKGKDINKKSSTRKNRYMLVFNARLAPAAAGKLGTLAKLDTKNPVMYVDFPTGRLKFLGTLVFPRNKYMVLKTGMTADILCEDIFENLVVFSEAWWVGTLEENPNEDKLPMPPELMAEKKHTNFDYCYGAGCRDGEEPTSQKLPSTSASKPDEQASQEGAGTKRPADVRDGGEEQKEEQEEEPKVDEEEDDSEALAARQKRRKTDTDASEPQDTAAPSTPAEAKEEKANEGKANGAAEEKSKQVASGSMDSPVKVEKPTEEEDESPLVRGPSRSKKRKAVIEGTPPVDGAPEETVARRESLRRTSIKPIYADKSDEEPDEEDSGKASKGNSSPESDEEEKPLKQLQQEKAKRGRGARSTGRTPVKQQGGAASAPSTSKGDKGLKVDSDGAILLGSDDDTPAKPAAAKSGAAKSTATKSAADKSTAAKSTATKPTATKAAAAKAATAKTPPKAASKRGRKPKAETNQKAAASAPASKAGAGVTIELLDDTPEKPTPLSQRPVRSAGKTATKRLAALRDSGVGMQEDDDSGKESEEEEAEASASEDDGGDSDFNG